ncbi:hypothetical protein ENHYD8BJ_80276 [Enhydrobacter sp. 8BJ]|nr:hypothetical protein ENHY17A_110168 [Moraxellaceae bacterium 17A]VXA95948.1 hypothetical protein ENHYDAX1_130252 [Enhydrobacter sp. AX1]VXB65065.1 hypothetical protein ENHYD8BJ_80276 [Enhydrobacter sp. 8BJ]
MIANLISQWQLKFQSAYLYFSRITLNATWFTLTPDCLLN